MRELERRVVLSVLDRKWREHLYEMDYLREGIGLRGYAQRDPLVEYQREGFDMFMAIMDGIKEESVGFLFNLEVAAGRRRRAGRGRRRGGAAAARAAVGRTSRGTTATTTGRRSRAKGLDQARTPQHLSYSAPSEDDTALAVPAAFGGDAQRSPAGRR